MVMCAPIFDLAAQDPVFSQFYANPLGLNPAFAGNTKAGTVAMNYRNQWPGINQAYVTYAASFDQYFPYINSGFGISVLADDAGRGLYKTTDLSLSYAYNVRYNRDIQMRLGIEAGFISSRVDWSRLVFLDQLDPEFGPLSPGGLPYPTTELPPEDGNSVSVLDVSMGLLIYTEQFYGGLSLKHLNAPQFSFLKINPDLIDGLPLAISVHGGAEINLLTVGRRGEVFMAPNVQFIKQGPFNQLNIGTIFRYFMVGTGVWYRHANVNPDALIFLIEGRKDIFRISYSYDMTLSSLGGTGGAHEISVIMNFDRGQKESKYNDCFNLFR
jgi:type IX secretion system PorP/SprF family membrane protein